VDEVIADADGLDAASEVGASYRELIAEVAREAGAQLREATATSGQLNEPDVAVKQEDPPLERYEDMADDENVDPDMTGGQDAAEEPAVEGAEPEMGQVLEDGFDFSFPAPTVVRGAL